MTDLAARGAAMPDLVAPHAKHSRGDDPPPAEIADGSRSRAGVGAPAGRPFGEVVDGPRSDAGVGAPVSRPPATTPQEAPAPGATGWPTARREVAVEERLERHRRELTAHCRQMLRSSSDAEDAVQETMVRAWRAFDRYEGRAALRTWLHRIATNVCVDMLRSRHRHPLPVDLASMTPVAVATSAVGRARTGAAPLASGWRRPSLDGRGVSPDRGPEEVAVDRETTSRAFLALLQLLPARQRAVLILHQVLRWKATEVAELLGTTVTAVNSALQRARATMASSGAALAAGSDPTHPTHPTDPDPAQRSLLDRYVDAFTHDDVQSLVALAAAGARDGAATAATTAGPPPDVGPVGVGDASLGRMARRDRGGGCPEAIANRQHRLRRQSRTSTVSYCLRLLGRWAIASGRDRAGVGNAA